MPETQGLGDPGAAWETNTTAALSFHNAIFYNGSLPYRERLKGVFNAFLLALAPIPDACVVSDVRASR